MCMMGIGGRVALFLLEVAERVQARHKRWKKVVAIRDVANVCYAT